MNRSNILAAVTLTALIGLAGFNTLLAQPLDIRLAKIYIGENLGDQFGSGMGAAGDLNGDGYADFLIGARFWRAGDSFGRAYIYLGGDSIPDEPTLTLNLNVIEGVFGYELGGVGDLNGDGYDDYSYIFYRNYRRSGSRQALLGRRHIVIGAICCSTRLSG